MSTFTHWFESRTKLIRLCCVSLAAISLLVSTLCAAGARSIADPLKSASQQVSPGEVPTNLSSSEWADIQAQIADHRYSPEALPDGGYTAVNPAHGWQIRYAPDGTTRIQPRSDRESDYHLGFSLTAVGNGQLQALSQPLRVTAEGTAVHYQWTDNLREWWVNSASGLEQWFELKERLTGAMEGEFLSLQLTLSTDLSGGQSGDALSFTDDTGTVISYDHLVAWDANGQKLPASMQWQSDGITLVIDEREARYPLTIDPTLKQQAYLKASNTGASDAFGSSVAVAGNTLVVGAKFEASAATGVNGDGSSNAVGGAGAAYVFTRSGTTWSQQAYLKASNTGFSDRFGHSVAVDGDTLAVGAYAEDSNATGVNGDGSDNSASGSGAAYVFTRSGTTWSQQAYLKASNTGVNDQFGISLVVAGDTLVVGAPNEASNTTGVNGNESDNSATGAGAAYVFTRSGTTWSQQAYLKASNTGGQDQFGISVAVAGDTLVVGAYAEDSNAIGVNGDGSDNSASASGAVYVFTRSGISWSQQAYLKASNAEAGDFFGWSVAVASDTLVVGASAEDSNSTGVNGNESDNSATGAGAAYVFTRSGTTWSQQAYLKASNTEIYDQFGISVAVAIDALVVGAFTEDSNATGVNGDGGNNSDDVAGAAYVFTRAGTTWSQQAYLKASNTGVGDQFGTSVTVADDTLVVGALAEDSNATGVNGDESSDSAGDAGAAYVFSLSSLRRVIVSSE